MGACRSGYFNIFMDELSVDMHRNELCILCLFARDVETRCLKNHVDLLPFPWGFRRIDLRGNAFISALASRMLSPTLIDSTKISVRHRLFAIAV